MSSAFPCFSRAFRVPSGSLVEDKGSTAAWETPAAMKIEEVGQKRMGNVQKGLSKKVTESSTFGLFNLLFASILFISLLSTRGTIHDQDPADRDP